ncbi:hypothetical protein [Clostridium intestinale]|uniref:hypothetical protein n=1 Tax=Clostridium intestinale TaxID=36845 RepID=UPI0028E493F9|nr:hypothetical protein [Clostridium intestinale]
MVETIYGKQRKEGYEKVLEEVKSNSANRSDFENAIKLRMFSWWSSWVPDYEGWLKIADGLYASECVIDAIGPEPQIYKDYRASMKHQRDAFDMDMGPIENCVVEGDTVALDYKMYMTPKVNMDKMQKGSTIVLKVTEFNKFDNVLGYDVPMVINLKLIASGLE